MVLIFEGLCTVLLSIAALPFFFSSAQPIPENVEFDSRTQSVETQRQQNSLNFSENEWLNTRQTAQKKSLAGSKSSYRLFTDVIIANCSHWKRYTFRVPIHRPGVLASPPIGKALESPPTLLLIRHLTARGFYYRLLLPCSNEGLKLSGAIDSRKYFDTNISYCVCNDEDRYAILVSGSYRIKDGGGRMIWRSRIITPVRMMKEIQNLERGIKQTRLFEKTVSNEPKYSTNKDSGHENVIYDENESSVRIIKRKTNYHGASLLETDPYAEEEQLWGVLGLKLLGRQRLTFTQLLHLDHITQNPTFLGISEELPRRPKNFQITRKQDENSSIPMYDNNDAPFEGLLDVEIVLPSSVEVRPTCFMPFLTLEAITKRRRKELENATHRTDGRNDTKNGKMNDHLFQRQLLYAEHLPAQPLLWWIDIFPDAVKQLNGHIIQSGSENINIRESSRAELVTILFPSHAFSAPPVLLLQLKDEYGPVPGLMRIIRIDRLSALVAIYKNCDMEKCVVIEQGNNCSTTTLPAIIGINWMAWEYITLD